LINSITRLYCHNNQITSFQYLPTSVNTLDCYNNQITSFQHLSNSVTVLYCDNNQINSFQYLVNSVTELFVRNNPISNIKNLLYIPLIFNCDINITPDEIYKNRVIHGLNKINNIFKNKQSNKIQKIWQNYWYNDLIDVEDIKMCRFGYYSWKQM